MDGDALSAAAQLAGWRARGAERMDPVRFAFIDALATRARAHEGAARRLLDARLSGLIATYASDLATWTPRSPRETAPSEDSALRLLVTALQSRTPGQPTADTHTGTPAGHAPAVLEEARRVWTQVRTDSQLRASLDDLPADAGPLNSGKLVHRALHFMRDVSPGYLQHFIAYTDTLSSLERLQQERSPVAPLGADSGRPARRSRTRKRPA
ncbi:DUF2894 domain-containing protein [Pseudoxanthomonas sp. PXM01]|uniref:DUF2894 domain-containing protein n=1 Tax=Pseudoxanthomonas sp. PXM01 TaxID=2769295 RepID=UPI0017821FB0|nr:DUF2894 domain-containing protein [Pseudoxanthomonas sp. PXM01]MBD9467839.1 DUF2894 domain-containing protein [Pseudoxanthomonas sp. PXM01]